MLVLRNGHQLISDSTQQSAETAEGHAKTSADNAAASAAEAGDSARTAIEYGGHPAMPDPDTKTWLIWDAERSEYYDSGISSELEGPQGVGISSIELVSGDHSPGTSDVYVITLTDGRTQNFSVWNGRNGEGAGDVLGISFQLLIPAAGWRDGQITVSDGRLLARSTHKYFVDADEASREEYLNCKVQAKDIVTDGFITFVSETVPDEDLTVSVLRLELSTNG